MESSNTTSISQLPTNNIIQKSNELPLQNTNNTNNINNIVLTKNEVIAETTSQMTNPGIQQIPNNASENNYNEMINQLQKASMAGATGLPTRDNPINPTLVSNDSQVKPNFIPEPENSNYINNSQTQDDLIYQNTKKQNYLDNLDTFYNEFQLPLLVCVLYFLFQLPIYRKTLKKALPSLFANDGNPNLYGYLFNSIIFGLSYFGLQNLLNYLN